MSIKIMALIWENGPAKQAERFVLLALADFANDAGECWPSIATVAKKTCLSERGVRQIMRALEGGGWLSTEVGGGRGGANIYQINPEPCAPPRNVVPPEQYAPPRNGTTQTRNETALNPERGAPEPLRTIKEPPSSEAVASVAAGNPPDFAKMVFTAGVQFLTAHGKTEAAARTMIGRWRKDHSDREIFDAFTACGKAGAIDPVPWITAALADKPPPRLWNLDPSKFNDDGTIRQ